MSVEVVPPMPMSERRTTSSMESTGVTLMPSAADHFLANASRVCLRREVQTISSNRYMVPRQRSALTPMVPMPTSPSTLGAFGPSHLSGTIAAAVLRMA